MPTDAQQDPSPIAIAEIHDVEITYRTTDRFGAHQHYDPNYRYVQHIEGSVQARVFDPETEDEHFHDLGTISLARIDLWEAGDRLGDALDAQSGEWEAYLQAFDAYEHEHPSSLLIVDRVVLEPWARGHGIGLHAAARAILTWQGESTLVVLTAFPLDKVGSAGRTGSEALVRHWARLGLDRVAAAGETPILAGMAEYQAIDDKLHELCAWPPASGV
jgi:hypothetical protein